MHGYGGESIESGENVLLYSSAFDAEGATQCVNLLQPTESSDRAVLEVAYSGAPSRRKATWQQVIGDLPEEWTIIKVDTDGQNATSRADLEHGHPVVETVPGQNMTQLGTRITMRVDSWAERDLDIAMCFNSVTALFQYTTDSLGLRFLDELTTKASSVGARSHYHVNPAAHDDATIEAIKGRFDRVFSSEGESLES